MATTKILQNCDHSIGGVKKLYLSSRQLNGNPITFPLEYNIVSGSSDSIIAVDSFDFDANTALIGGQTLEWKEILNLNGNILFEETYNEDRQGKNYIKTLTISLANVNYDTNSAMKELIFTSEGEFAISNAVAFIIDDNNNKWIVGYDRPLILQGGLEINISDDNYYRLTFRSISYSRTRNYIIS